MKKLIFNKKTISNFPSFPRKLFSNTKTETNTSSNNDNSINNETLSIEDYKYLNNKQEYLKLIRLYHFNYSSSNKANLDIQAEYYKALFYNKIKDIGKSSVFNDQKYQNRLAQILLKYKNNQRNSFLFSLLFISLFGYLIFSNLIKNNGYELKIEIDTGDKSSNSSKSSSNNSFQSDNIFKLMKGNEFQLKLETNIKTTLNDVKGIDEVKEEIEQLIRMIKDPQKYREAGAKLPKGILLAGKPGTGKTLIAKAIAGDSKVNFISVSGSDFEEMFVGIGAERVKKLFKFAREKKPCIIFIDEIDALLAKSKRTTNEHSSSRATINQFLSEMDGFQSLDDVFVLGATNHEKDLDSAAIRPGRFDKKIYINVPDSVGREEIADYYLNKIKLDKDKKVTNHIISQMTTGFTGAEIENLINLSAISAVNNNTNMLTLNIITEARDRIMMGISRKYFTDVNKRRYMTSVHEIGHTLVCYLNPLCKNSLLKVTIVPAGPALGVTQRLDVEDTVYSKEFLLSTVDVAMGGHVAEEMMFGEGNVTAGCSSDLSKATEIARKMVAELGMYGDEIGYLFVEKSEEPREEKLGDKQKEAINDKVNTILRESHDKVKKTLEDHSVDVKRLSQALFKYNTLDMEEIDLVMNNKEHLITRVLAREEYSDKNAFKRS